MTIEIKPYSEHYQSGVLAVLKRNFSWMGNVSDEALYNWLSPLVEYSWIKDVSLSDVPYKHGAVLIDDNSVVGYFGTIYSYRTTDNKCILCLNFSTWAIDEEYRTYVFSAIKELSATSDVIVNFTPSPSMQKVCVKLFDFECVSDKHFIFAPVPKLLENEVKLHFVRDANEIEDDNERRAFQDHQKYNVKCVCFRAGQDAGYIFYLSQGKRIKKFIPCRWIRVLRLVNPELFTHYRREIIWKIQRHEYGFAFFDLDSIFLGDKDVVYPGAFVRESCRLRFSQNENNYHPDFLYSELSMLKAV